MGAESTQPDESAELRAECAFYRELLELGRHDDPQAFVEATLARVTTIARARRGYLELRDERADDPFWIGHASTPEDRATFREALSAGVIAEAIESGRAVVTASALIDARFRDRGSVRSNRIEAILCVPIMHSGKVSGVIYLQDRELPGPFTEADCRRVEELALHIEPFVERLQLRRRRERKADATLRHREGLRTEGVIGRSPALAKVLQQVALVTAHETSVIITGPTGSGKTQIARLIHDNSPRAAHPFVELNCAALPESLIESELFGTAAGAHSTATHAREGKVGAAHRGTLFLDEVGELSLAAQSKLLQLLQSHTYYPLGSATPRSVDIRVLAATNADLREAMDRRAFREDLYYRLHVLPIRMPALAERPADLPLLADHFAELACERASVRRLRLSPAAESRVECSDWPGNVRQLAHAIEAAVLRAIGDDADQIGVRHIFPDDGAPEEEQHATYQDQVSRFKRDLLARTLDATDWNVSEASRRLDLARSQLTKLIRAFSLVRPERAG